MKLTELLKGLEYNQKFEDKEITSLCCDTRQVKKDSLFFCFKGKQTDGHKFAGEALEKGAAFVVAERSLGLENEVVVEDTKKAYAVCCANLYDNPQKKVKLIGVTGTNGKTSTTYLIRDILKESGIRCGLIGTVVNETPESVVPSKFTTPDSLSFYSLLHEMVKARCEYVVVEVSSFGLEQRRVWGCHFDISLFTNLTQDHLDYHDTMENYYKAKKLLFDVSDKAVICIDDDYGKRMASEVPCQVRTFSIKDDMADYTAKSINLTLENTEKIKVQEVKQPEKPRVEEKQSTPPVTIKENKDFINEGDKNYKKNNYDAAIKNYQDALQLVPNDAVTLLKLGNIYNKVKNDNEKAINYYQKSIIVNPEYTDGWFNLGLSYANENNLIESQKSFEKVIALDPNYNLGYAYYALGMALEHQGKKSEAVKNYKLFIKHNNDNTTINTVQEKIKELSK